MCCNVNKDEFTTKMSENLRVLRNKLRLKQSDLAKKVGISRQTLLEIENGKRTMQWSIFLALLSVFREDKGTRDLIEHFGIYTPELGKYLVSPDNTSAD